jgi:DNA-binding response OmpR family regulator
MENTSASAHILLVDAERLEAAAAVRLLQAAGYAVSVAENVTEAIEAVTAQPPDLAILDIAMPGLPGLSLSETLRHRFGVPFLFHSAMCDADTVREASAAGALAFIVKPLASQQFVFTISTALQRAQELQRLREAEAHLCSTLQQGREVSIAIGVVMERLHVNQQQALVALRSYARSHRRRLHECSEELLDSMQRVNAIKADFSANARSAESIFSRATDGAHTPRMIHHEDRAAGRG